MSRKYSLARHPIHTAVATLNFGLISGGSTAELTVTISGASAGDIVALGAPSGIEAGLIWSAYVSALNTVTIRIHNSTGSPVDPASASWKVSVVKF